MTLKKSQLLRGSVMCVCEILGHVHGCSCVCRDVKLFASVFTMKGCVVFYSLFFS